MSDVFFGEQMLKSPSSAGGRLDGYAKGINGSLLTAEQKMLTAKVKLHMARPKMKLDLNHGLKIGLQHGLCVL